ncbi:2-hydroxyacid dehydrogenase [Ketogulonicigenium vulgare]|uniref:Putative glycerate dehydrogenase (GyaR-like protein) n=1 Tax=Ketogulonicigenium vulgare (strain WSH-001) TaxID=759362 RepID=F9Y6Z9_KETVW|nr:2-hydroxyacid dehydrogenase [Ketogulonicigenium vulgare]ADO43938.1 D-isomer specific 2-hydroxyacid dehydrogenase, NAD-binding protein [Ketogulonicigenium vulgare Y25]AEM42189.1 putative glycerate dehydrogenase (GyaR-like protein) [Ketogulonicigenium vulgare WSH-001]ALJ79814.1 hydroxyacid dehydrogenase [Ketogulonicigenium vulgare]ANW32728.1 hydroxyacid dehydrogenase [Ketogulonicigenium vulgare]AOZ55969.1 D-isomer specific 2-hydroxyacid dehydrogenase, NAD-binding protein [Ketogulonicigenium v
MTIELLQTSPLAPALVEKMRAHFTVHQLYNAPDPEALLAEVGPRIRAATSGVAPADLIARLPALEIVANFGAGYDKVDTDACAARGIRVTNAPAQMLNDVVAELTVGMMIGQERRIAWHDDFVRAGKWLTGHAPLTGTLTGKKAGIVGMGRIGIEIAERLVPMKMEILYTARSAKPELPYRYVADLVELAREVDWLVVIVPGGAGTSKLISREVLEALGPQGQIVNLARGTVIDEAAMVELLQAGGLGGAALDVFENEPQVPEALFAMENVLLLPHIGGAVEAARTAMGDLMLGNLLAHFEGRPLLTPVV